MITIIIIKYILYTINGTCQHNFQNKLYILTFFHVRDRVDRERMVPQ